MPYKCRTGWIHASLFIGQSENGCEQARQASAEVGTLEVGIIGYYAQRPMIDFAGLIQPEVAAQLTHNATYEDAALWAVSRYAPQYLVLHDGVFPRLEQGYTADRCQPVKHFIGKDYGYSLDMTIYTCQ